MNNYNKNKMKKESIYIPKLKREIDFYIGMNAQDNFDIIDQSEPEDLWFHVEGQASCHIVASLSKEEIDRKEKGYIIRQGAELCKRFSKQKSQKNLAIVYTRIKFVTKTNIIGQVEVENTSLITI